MKPRKKLLFLVCACIFCLAHAPSPILPEHITSADPFNPDSASSWTNQVYPPQFQDNNGRWLYLPSVGTQPYISIFIIQSSACGYLYVRSKAELPTLGSKIRLSANLDLVFSVQQVVDGASQPAGSVLGSSSAFAYVCSVDGKQYKLNSAPGRWTNDVLLPAEYGLPDISDTGVAAPPQFYEIDKSLNVTDPLIVCPRVSNCVADTQFVCDKLGSDVYFAIHCTCKPTSLAKSWNGSLMSFSDANDIVGALPLRVWSSTPNAVIRYTTDGSDPSEDYGNLVYSGDTICLSHSGVIKAVSYLPRILRDPVRRSRITQIPYTRIRMVEPRIRILPVGHYQTMLELVNEPCPLDGSGGYLSVQVVDSYRILRSTGCPTYPISGPVPTPATYKTWEFHLPSIPTLMNESMLVMNLSGIIGVAVNGVPMFAAPDSLQDASYQEELRLRDSCGGLSFSVKCDSTTCSESSSFSYTLQGLYHYRPFPTCLLTNESDGHSSLLGFKVDGIPVYGPFQSLNFVPTDLDECGGHVDAVHRFYHYHVVLGNPRLMNCFKGCVNADMIVHLNPMLAQSVDPHCVPAAVQQVQAYSSFLHRQIPGAILESSLLFPGNYSSYMSVEVSCSYLEGVGVVVYNVTGNKYLRCEGLDCVKVTGDSVSGRAIGRAQVVVYDQAVVSARCESPGLEASLVRATSELKVYNVAFNPLWERTYGLWNFTDRSTYHGIYQRQRSIVQGGCTEHYDTLVSPSLVLDLSGKMGDLLLSPPSCITTEPSWNFADMPSLYNMSSDSLGLSGLTFDQSIAVNGLIVPSPASDLVSTGKLPVTSLTLELWVGGVDLSKGSGIFCGIVTLRPGFLGKGWYVGYDVVTVGAEKLVEIYFSIATTGNDVHGRGGLRTVRKRYPSTLLSNWTHIACVYDASQIFLYINGELDAVQQACDVGVCGNISYPVIDNLFIKENVYFSVGKLQLNNKDVWFNGVFGWLRIMESVLSPVQVKASSQRMRYGLSVSPCPVGSYGDYEGVKPCLPCPLGHFSSVAGESQCSPCPAGSYADETGLVACKACPDGVLTPSVGSTSSADCTGPAFCSNLLDNCSPYASCQDVAGSFECTCREGYVGDGVACAAVCGDGLVVEGEECDDGNAWNLDGCNASCGVEEGFNCSAAGGPDSCACTLSSSECCMREYWGCLSNRLACDSDCFQSLNVCFQKNPSILSYKDNQVMTGSGLIAWEALFRSNCNPERMKMCYETFDYCKFSAGSLARATASPTCPSVDCVDAYASCINTEACR
uniref:EGF-like domain-containing protein n=1 Tax=Hanusia phi TaxID=3032 RepID=A0A7S0ET74_9CRYP|mmetsp:Transcript_30023/g.67925  ORF Transcript_30023/g.67925 Transcript_30023/m.67925 type:complete len:1272 (+) Transcript_30023:370-4185(+)